MNERPYFVIDAFTSERYAGNAAAVVLDAEGLDDRQMQAIAAEFNLSETTFVLPPSSPSPTALRAESRGAAPEASAEPSTAGATPGADLRFRWFTPTTEADMCGHATIAGVHALREAGRLPSSDSATSPSLAIATRSGVLRAYVESLPQTPTKQVIWLDLIDPTLTEHRFEAEVMAEILGLPVDALDLDLPSMKTQDRDVLVFVKDFMALTSARPRFDRLGEAQAREGLRGLSLATVHTLTPTIHVQSRFFAPAAGIDEDPVTGSVHGPLAAYLVMHGLVPVDNGLAGVQCVQGKPGGRTGLVWALVQEQGEGKYGVRIGGQAVTSMRGQLFG